MFDAAGSRLSFTVTGGIAETFRVSFWVGTRQHDVTGATFQAAAYTAHGSVHELVAVLPVQHDERENAVLLSVPALEAGHYLWELRATDAAGEESRLLYGVLTALSAADVLAKVQAADESELRELAVQQADGTAAALVLRWQACSAASMQAAEAARHAAAAAAARDAAERSAAEAAKSAAEAGSASVREAEQARDEAAKSADAAAKSAEEAHADSELVRTVNELWQTKLERVVWCNEDTGTVWVYDHDTGASYRGEDGKCPFVGETGTWWVWDAATKQFLDSGEKVRGEDGRSPFINAAGNWVRWDDTARAWVDTGCRALGVDGRDGECVVRHIVASVEEIPTCGETCNGGHFYYVPCEGAATAGGVRFYEVYAWLTDAEGAGSWQLVGEKNDVATARVLGLTKLGTDAEVADGAPVGFNADHQLSVPKAGYTTPGAMRPSLPETLDSGGACGVDAEGRIWVQPCAYGRYGAGKPSFGGVAEVAGVGMMADGSYGLPWATLTQGGAVKLGSSLLELNAIPYVVGVGATRDHALANNLLNGGALQHQKPAGWNACGMPWLNTARLNAASFYLGLVTSSSFRQSQSLGLELEAATVSLLGGVRLADAVTATGQGVPTAAVMWGFLHENYYTKNEVYSRGQANDRFLTIADAERKYCLFDKEYHEAVQRRCRAIADEAAETCEQGARRCETIAEKAEAACKGIADKMQAEADSLLRKTDNLDCIEVVTQGQYNRLAKVDAKTIYFIVQG